MVNKEDKNGGHFASAYKLKSKEETQRHYKSWAATYDKEVGEENHYAQPQRVAEMLKRFQPLSDSMILDAGCGSGLSGLALFKAGYSNIHGCDFSPEMLNKCAEKQVYGKLFEADLNLGQPDLADQSYDAITCVGVFSFGHVDPDACDDLLRLIAPGGHLIIALNEKYWEEGNLERKLADLCASGTCELLAKEFGDHLPGHEVRGWVLALRKS